MLGRGRQAVANVGRCFYDRSCRVVLKRTINKGQGNSADTTWCCRTHGWPYQAWLPGRQDNSTAIKRDRLCNKPPSDSLMSWATLNMLFEGAATLLDDTRRPLLSVVSSLGNLMFQYGQFIFVCHLPKLMQVLVIE